MDVLCKAGGVVETKNTGYSRLALEHFARCFGTTVEDIPNDCRELIAKKDFRYRPLSASDRDDTIMRILKSIDSGSLSETGPAKKAAWEKGWSENLQNFVDKSFDLSELVPKYYRPGGILRLNRDFITALDPDFEFNFFQVLRLWLYRKYLKDVQSVFEFGCGPGHNLVALAAIYPEKKIHGLDWAAAARDLVSKIAEVRGYNMSGYLFDMFSPNENLIIPANSAAVTFGALEQLGRNHGAFLQFLLRKRPSLCLHVEPFAELYDDNNLLDYLAIKYQQKRNYLSGYLKRLRQLEHDGQIDIHRVQRLFFGNLNYEGWSFVLWSPKPKAG
ncbi:MAG: class I SAM-dependent methyltransferase [Chloroflexi bacterium]|nr:class I SAM-dependent methyltransferase [Chloroflexota bacterium]